MRLTYLLLLSLLFISTNANAQTTEFFEDESISSSSFTADGATFDVTSVEGFDVFEFTNGGWNGAAPDDRFIDNSSGTTANTGTSFTVKLNDNGLFSVADLYLFCSKTNLTNHTGTATFIGMLNNNNVYSFTKSSGFSDTETFSPNNGFTYIDFATEGASDYTDEPIDELVISSTGNLDYMALDAFQFELVILPIELISFSGLSLEKSIKLLWETAQEINNEKFVIEESQDGRNFQTIGETKGYGTTSDQKDYSFEIENPQNGISYYRLKQMDFDGQFEYSKMISINFQDKSRQIGKFYPNPSKSGLVNLNYTTQSVKEITVGVFDIIGKLVANQVRQISSGRNNLSFDFSALNKGIYIIKIGDDRNSIHRELIIE